MSLPPLPTTSNEFDTWRLLLRSFKGQMPINPPIITTSTNFSSSSMLHACINIYKLPFGAKRILDGASVLEAEGKTIVDAVRNKLAPVKDGKWDGMKGKM